MTARQSEEFQRPRALARRIGFVLVNDRVPRANANCARCCARIERGYVREPLTRLVYCDAQCFTAYEKTALPAVIDPARRVS